MMETLIAHPDSKDKLAALKAFMKALKINFDIEKDVPLPSVADDIREAMDEVKRHEKGEINLPDARALLHDL